MPKLVKLKVKKEQTLPAVCVAKAFSKEELNQFRYKMTGAPEAVKQFYDSTLKTAKAGKTKRNTHSCVQFSATKGLRRSISRSSLRAHMPKDGKKLKNGKVGKR